MIPIAIVAGAIAGRWWIVPLVAVAWSVLLLAMGICDLACSPGSAALAAANTAVGVVLHKGVRLVGQALRGTTRSA